MKTISNVTVTALAALAILAGVAYWYFRLDAGPLLVASPGSQPGALGGGGKAGGPSAGMPVKVAAVSVRTVADELSAVGSLLANESVVIRPEIAGRIAAIHFAEGQAVSAGAKLVSMDAAEFRAQLAGSSADARLNAQRLKRAEELRLQGFISQQALDEARENLARANARRREDEVRVSKTEIRAPFAGVTGLRQVSPGAYVKPGDDMVRLESIDTLKVDFRVPELYRNRLQNGQEIILRVDAFSDKQFTGRVYAMESTVDERTRTLLLRARLENPQRLLQPGMFTRVSLVLGKRDRAMVVPEQAIVPKGQDSFVFRVVAGKAVLTKVQIGKREPGYAEILSGINASDQVVTDGQIKLQDGAPVSVINASSTTNAGVPKG